MNPAELAAELAGAAGHIGATEMDALKRCGVTGAALVKAVHRCWPFSPIGGARICTDGDLWQPDEAGRPAILQPVITYGVLIDVVAWRLDAPSRWWRRTGYAAALGDDAIDGAAIHFDGEEDPLTLHCSPVAWLAAGGSGACLLDWTVAAITLAGVHRFLTDDPSLARQIDRALRQPAADFEIRLTREVAA